MGLTVWPILCEMPGSTYFAGKAEKWESGKTGKRCMERRHSGVSAKQRRHPEPKGNQPGGLGLPEREQPALGH